MDKRDYTASSTEGEPFTFPVYTKEEVKQVEDGWRCVGKTTFRASEQLRFTMIWATFFFITGSIGLLSLGIAAWVWIVRRGT